MCQMQGVDQGQGIDVSDRAELGLRTMICLFSVAYR